MDQYDLKIISELQKDGRISATKLADKIGLSKTPCITRMRRLEEDGHILGYTAIVDPVKLGAGHIAFVQVTLSSTKSSTLTAFNEEVRRIPEITQCHMMAAGFDYLLKVRTKDITAFRRVLSENISMLPDVSQTSTFVAMEAVKDIGRTSSEIS